MRDCPHCGTSVPAASRYCPECGRPLAAPGTEPTRLYGRLWPPDPLVLVCALVAIGGVALLAAGEWAWGLVALLAAAVVLLGRQLGRRRVTWAVTDFRARAAATREAMAARSREQLDLFRARRELADLEASRERLFRDLGAAAYQGDETGEEAARTAVAAVLERIAEKEAEIETLRREAEDRVQRAQAPVQATEKLENS